MVQHDIVSEILTFEQKDLQVIAEEIADDPATVVRKVAPGRASYRAEKTVGGVAERLPAVEVATRSELENYVAPARHAIENILQNGPEAHLTAEEGVALEAIVLPLGRPAILIQDGSFFPAPGAWKDVLEKHRDAIEKVFDSVGRVEVAGHPDLSWVGTGWLAAPGVIMTNRHVATEFAMADGAGWKFTPQMSAWTDFNEELSASVSRDVRLTEVIGIHPEFDLALLACESCEAPPLPISATGTQAGAKVYVVGYPAADGRRNDPDEMQRIFAGVYNVKRLQPGEIRSVEGSKVVHDCSTLGGNSGSCVVDLETAEVVGLHFGGRYLQGNFAVALWELADDPLLRSAGVKITV